MAKTTSKIAESETVEVEIFSVSIKVIRVNNKQMTLAVFRQLPRGTENDSSKLWGIVKYAGIGEHQGYWLVFSNDGKLFRRELELNQRRIDHWRLNEVKRALERHNDSYYQSYMDKPGYWDDQLKSYNADHVQLEKEKHERYKIEHADKAKPLQKAVDAEEQIVFKLEQKEVNRLSYEHDLVKKLPQLFIAV